MLNKNLVIIFSILYLINLSRSQSTCPVQQNQLLNDAQRCKCGIKIDGHIYIYCARKQLKQLPKFTKSSILYDELILSGNQISSVQTNSFMGLKVKRLLLDDNPLEYIEANSFIELANYLEELIISVNQDVLNRPKISPNLFQSLLNLKIIKLNGLDFDTEKFGVLKSNTFNRTRKLEIINLIDSGINKIEANSLAGVETSLKELNLDNNQLTNLNDLINEMKRMKRLQTLILSRNRIRQLARLGLDSIQFNLNDMYLDLSYNGIALIDEYAFGITSFDSTSTGLVNSIGKLNLNNNELNQFQLNFLTQLTSLKELYLDYNKIDYLPDNLFINSRRLEVLSLKGNLIQVLNSEYIFSGLHFNLKRLNLASNKLKKLSKKVFVNLNKLKDLNIEKNYLGLHFQDMLENNVNLMNTFDGIESELKYLNLESNFLTQEHLGSLINLLNLEQLKLANNNFKGLNFANLFEFYRNLSYLDLQNTSLNQIPYFMGLNRTLLSLNLGQNSICNVNGLNLKKHYFKLKFLSLNQNPLKCDCHLINLRKWIDDLNSLNNFNNLNGSSDIKFKCYGSNKYLNDMNINDLICENDFNDKCELDYDEFSLLKTSTPTKASTSSSSIVTTSTTSTTTTHEEIRIIESNPSTIQKLFTTPTLRENIGMYLLNSHENLLKNQLQFQNTVHSNSFLSSIEIKQTLLGSFIGALSVILIVLVLVCLIKTTRHKLLGKEVSLCNSDEKDKSSTTNTTNASASPYELGKLSLQTLCLNSNCNTSSASSSSSSTASQHTTNSSCVCALINQSNGNDLLNLEKQCLFTKMDPIRLSMFNRQNYLNHLKQNPNANNLHYLASSLAYQSPSQSVSTSPAPYQLNDLNSELLNQGVGNTYDKLHQSQSRILSNTTSNSSLRPNGFSTLVPNQLLTSTLSFHNQHMLNSSKLGDLLNVAETTPFLIIANPNQLNLQNEFLNTNTFKAQNDQHTYHEIGDVLISMNQNRTFNSSNNNKSQQNSQTIQLVSDLNKPNEMYI